ncbi:MAG: hypothetical protein L6R40_005082 [Gallowayella cf. fulva]|nr:MAG: hypothetical protein L6R40_005082 [Xanthomendoza cf. fulva]
MIQGPLSIEKTSGQKDSKDDGTPDEPGGGQRSPTAFPRINQGVDKPKFPATISFTTWAPQARQENPLMAAQTPAVVIDNSTGFSKLGFAGNDAPSFVLPTAIATQGGLSAKRGTDDLDYLIGEKALVAAAGQYICAFRPSRHYEAAREMEL